MRNAICVLVLLASRAWALDVKANNATSLPPSARFEIVQSSLLARLTFKLDKIEGKVWQLFEGQGKELGWLTMAVKDLPKIPAGSTSPRFQIFASGMLAGSTFMLDTFTGQVWVVKTFAPPAESVLYWEPMAK